MPFLFQFCTSCDSFAAEPPSMNCSCPVEMSFAGSPREMRLSSRFSAFYRIRNVLHGREIELAAGRILAAEAEQQSAGLMQLRRGCGMGFH